MEIRKFHKRTADKRRAYRRVGARDACASKKKEGFSFSLLYSLGLPSLQKDPLKVREYNVFVYQNTTRRIHFSQYQFTHFCHIFGSDD